MYCNFLFYIISIDLINVISCLFVSYESFIPLKYVEICNRTFRSPCICLDDILLKPIVGRLKTQNQAQFLSFKKRLTTFNGSSFAVTARCCASGFFPLITLYLWICVFSSRWASFRRSSFCANSASLRQEPASCSTKIFSAREQTQGKKSERTCNVE